MNVNKKLSILMKVFKLLIFYILPLQLISFFAFGIDCENLFGKINRYIAEEIVKEDIKTGKIPTAQVPPRDSSQSSISELERLGYLEILSLFGLGLPRGVGFVDHQGFSSNIGFVKLEDTSHAIPVKVPHEYNGKIYETEAIMSINAFRSNLIESLKGIEKKWLADPQAPAVVVYLHGGGTTTANSSAALNIANHFSRLGISVISIDLFLHGQGPETLPGDGGFMGVVEFIKSFIEEYVPPSVPVYIYGHSYGGFFADIIARLEYEGALKFSQLAGILNASGPTPTPGETPDKKIQNEVESQDLSKTEGVPSQERDILLNFAKQGKLGFLQELYIMMQLLERSFSAVDENFDFDRDFDRDKGVPYYVLMGAKDPLVYLGREEAFNKSYENLTTLPFDLFKVYLFDELFYRGGPLKKMGHLVSDYHLTKSEEKGKTGTSIDIQILENMIVTDIVKTRGLQDEKLDESNADENEKPTLEERIERSMEELKNPNSKIDEMRALLISESKGFVSERLQEELGLDKSDANRVAIALEKISKIAALFSDNLPFRKWLSELSIQISTPDEHVHRNIYGKIDKNKDGLYLENMEKIRELSQKYHPTEVLYENLKTLALLSPSYNNISEVISVVDSIDSLNLKWNVFIDSKLKTQTQKIFESIESVKKLKLEKTSFEEIQKEIAGLIEEARSFITSKYGSLQRSQEKSILSQFDKLLKEQNREGFEEALNNFPYSERKLTNSNSLPQATKERLLDFFESYQDPTNNKDLKDAILRDTHRIIKQHHPYFQLYSVFERILKGEHQNLTPSRVGPTIGSIERKLETEVYSNPQTKTHLNLILENLNKIREGNQVNESILNIKESSEILLKKTENSFPVSNNPFSIKQFSKPMSKEEFEEALKIIDIPEGIRSEYINNFYKTKTNVSGNREFLEELRRHAKAPYTLNELIQKLIFPKTYIEKIERLSPYFEGEIQKEIKLIIRHLKDNPEQGQVSILKFMFENYYEQLPVHVDIKFLEEKAEDIKNSYPKVAKDGTKVVEDLHEAFETKKRWDDFKNALDIPTKEDFESNESYEKKINKIKSLVESIRSEEEEKESLKEDQKNKIKKIEKLEKQLSENKKKFKDIIPTLRENSREEDLFKTLEKENASFKKLINELLTEIRKQAGEFAKKLEKSNTSESQEDFKLTTEDLIESSAKLSKKYKYDEKLEGYKKIYEETNNFIIQRALEGDFGPNVKNLALSLFGEGDDSGYNLVTSLNVHAQELSNIEIEILKISEALANLKGEYYKLHPFDSLDSSKPLSGRIFSIDIDKLGKEELLNHIVIQADNIKAILEISSSFKAKHYPTPSLD